MADRDCVEEEVAARHSIANTSAVNVRTLAS
jgi:hypothetical protein